MKAEFIDIHEFSRAQLLKRATEAAEADCASCVVRHAEVVTAAQRVRQRLAERVEQHKVIRMWR